MVGELGRYGDLKTPDAHAEVFKELTDSLKTSQVTKADFSSCGIGPVALGHLGEWVREATVERLGYDLSVDRLCRFGGAPLSRDNRLTLAESGLHPNSSLQVLGRLRGGAEVTLFSMDWSRARRS